MHSGLLDSRKEEHMKKTCEEAITELESVPFMFPDSSLGDAYCNPDELPKITVDAKSKDC